VRPRSVISVLRARARNRTASPRSHPRGSRAPALDYGYSRAVRRTRPSPIAGPGARWPDREICLCRVRFRRRRPLVSGASFLAIALSPKHSPPAGRPEHESDRPAPRSLTRACGRLRASGRLRGLLAVGGVIRSSASGR